MNWIRFASRLAVASGLLLMIMTAGSLRDAVAACTAGCAEVTGKQVIQRKLLGTQGGIPVYSYQYD